MGFLPMEEIPNLDYAEEKRRQKLQRQYLANVTETTEIYGFSIIRQFNELRELRNRAGDITRTQTVRVILEDRFYSKNRESLFQVYRIELLRFATDANARVVWHEIVQVADDAIRSQIDGGILHTRIDPNTREEIIHGRR